ncbi:hypothetical protein BGZ91_006336, partial [Linnemannia elongata]
MTTTTGTPTMAASEIQEQLQQLQLRDEVVEGAAPAEVTETVAGVAGGSADPSGLLTSASGRPVYPRRIPMPIAVAPMVDVTTS